jgi:hypothetical protein
MVPRATLPVPSSSDRIVLSDRDSPGPKLQQNLVRLSRDGSVVWRAELPDQVLDCFLSVYGGEYAVKARRALFPSRKSPNGIPLMPPGMPARASTLATGASPVTDQVNVTP